MYPILPACLYDMTHIGNIVLLEIKNHLIKFTNLRCTKLVPLANITLYLFNLTFYIKYTTVLYKVVDVILYTHLLVCSLHAPKWSVRSKVKEWHFGTVKCSCPLPNRSMPSIAYLIIIQNDLLVKTVPILLYFEC